MIGVRNSPTEIDQLKKLSPKLPCEKAVNEENIVLGVGKTHIARMETRRNGSATSENDLELELHAK